MFGVAGSLPPVTVFLLYHLAGFTKRQRFGLSKELEQQFRMVIDGGLWVIAGAMKSHGTILSLVNQLVERVLTVGARLTPDDWASLVIHRVAVTVNVFTVDSILPC